ncbi:hypothetical protein [Acidaminobacter hydrogenoformans]|uniref:Uncharacterized protein n=1 Tax=Acidaminobacter hydrogenoformans DSM 2784 TaxID=1120920 RepID=A0A1G5RSB6_9FIRM|nr:hypothetical protein [Acidaminobacter hydrogenoformans]SCZ76886.1 hypothetical protein SAMN03080599_00456 [Acidaminobacter hydrogenoformans DSM 2784]
MYRYKKSEIYLQAAVGAMFIIFGVMLGNWVYLSILGLVSLFLFKDCLKQMKTVIEVKGDRIELRTGDKVTQTILYKNLQFITRTRRNKKWVVVGHDKNIFYIRPAIIDHEKLLSEVLMFNRKNKKVYIHESIEIK